MIFEDGNIQFSYKFYFLFKINWLFILILILITIFWVNTIYSDPFHIWLIIKEYWSAGSWRNLFAKVYTFCKCLYVINVGFVMGTHIYLISIWSNVVGCVVRENFLNKIN